MGTKSKEQEKGHKGLFSSFEKLRTSFRGSSKSDAIRDWEQRQENKRNEKGLFASMDAKGHGSTSGNFEGWGGSRTKEKVMTVYVPIRINFTPTTASRPVSRASTELPPYKECFETPDQVTAEGRIDNKRTGIYPKCPSPDSDDEIERAKLKSWIEYNESLELSVDKPTYLQRSRNTTVCSSPALGTVFEGYDENDSFVESDEINLVLSCTEYDGDWDSADEQDDKDSDMGEAEEAMRLTTPFNQGVPSGRRCPKNRIHPIQDPGTTEGQYGVPEDKVILRLKGGANSNKGDSVDQMDTDSLPSTSKGKKRLTDMSGYTEIVTPPSKRNKENTPSPETESGKTSSFQNRGRMVLRYFESFKTACKKKLSATAQQELDRGVDMVNDLLTEVCSENMIIYGRYLELKERLEEKKKKVKFEIPSVKQTTSDINSAEIVTTDNEEGTSNTKKGKRKRKRKTKAESKESTKRSDAEDSGRDSGSERSKTGTIKKSKKEKEKEMLDKCRSQAAPIKFIVATGD